jgi:hypothetical protein
MAVIDDEGRLFGVVNVVDALVVLVVLAMVVAAGALLLGGSGDQAPEGETRYATLVIEPSSDAVADQVRAGRNATAEYRAGPRQAGEQAVTVTDVFVTPTSRGETVTVARVRYEADGATVLSQVGTDLRLNASTYRLNATVEQAGGDDETLATRTTTVSTAATVSPATADAVTEGDSLRVGNRTVGEVTEVRTIPNDDAQNVSLRLGMDLRTITLSGGPQFGGHSVTVGSSVPLRTDKYSTNVTVQRLGGTQPAGEAVNATVEVSWEGVRPSAAAALAEGLAEQHRGSDARITDLEQSPAQVILTTDDGRIVERDHPRNLDVTMTVEVEARRTSEGLRFHDRPLQRGEGIVLDFGTVTVTGRVDSFEP